MNRNPFLPVRIRTAGGQSYRIMLPGQMGFFGGPNRRVLMLGSRCQVPLESIDAIDLESVPEDFTVSSNGTDSKMTVEKFDEFLKRRPFVPFSVHAADGGSFEVKGPEFASRTQKGRTIFVSTGGETTEWIDLLLVTRISSGVNNPSVSPKEE